MSSLKDDQLVAVMRAVLKLPIEQRTVLLRHIATRLPMYISCFTDTDLDKAVRVVLREVMVVWPCKGWPSISAAYRGARSVALCFLAPGRRGLSKNSRCASS
jgi:hypothetical protein